MAREIWVQSQVESYQRLKKWHLMLSCLTLSIIRYVSRVKWSNPGKGVAPSPTPRCSSYRKGSLRVTLDYGCQLYLHAQNNSVIENEIYNILWDFAVETELLMPTRGPGLVLINKKKRICCLVDFSVLADHLEENKSKKADKFLGLAHELKNCGRWGVTVIISVDSAPGVVLKILEEMEISGRSEII